MAEVSELLSIRAARRALAARAIPRVYRLLVKGGVSQHRIARRTRQRQSEVHEILHGRQVQFVTVLERICDGLGCPGGGYGWPTLRTRRRARPRTGWA